VGLPGEEEIVLGAVGFGEVDFHLIEKNKISHR
jgi:hypothetical protein